jgi:iron complex transport system ATP-binding protein
VLEARALAVRRGRHEVLHGIDLALAPGEALAVVGPNAAGKSTLLRALAGLLAPARGEVLLHGRALGGWARGSVAQALAVVTAEPDETSTLTVEDRVALGRYPHRGPFLPLGQRDREAIGRALGRTGINDLARRRLATLSAGERQLAALARGLAQEPEALLLDEPAAHLDVGHQLGLFRVLDEVRARGVAVLAVVHDLQRAAAWAERMILIAGGQVAAQGRPAEVLADPAAEAAFQVAIRGHAVAGLPHPLYSFEERS